MEIEYLKQLMQLFDQSTATELSIEEEGTKVHLSRQPAQQTVQMVATAASTGTCIPQNVHQQSGSHKLLILQMRRLFRLLRQLTYISFTRQSLALSTELLLPKHHLSSKWVTKLV
jgi:hypothetical protein